MLRPDGEGHAETIEVRCAIEGFCTHRIAGQLTTEKGKRLLDELGEILEQMRNAKMQTTAQTFIDCDHAFFIWPSSAMWRTMSLISCSSSFCI